MRGTETSDKNCFYHQIHGYRIKETKTKTTKRMTVTLRESTCVIHAFIDSLYEKK